MNKDVIVNILGELKISPQKNTLLGTFLDTLNDSQNDADSEAGDPPSSVDKDAQKRVFDRLKRLQKIALSMPILKLGAEATTINEVNQAKAQGIERLIDLPDNVITALNSLGERVSISLQNINELKSLDIDELVQKFKLSSAPRGIEVSILALIISVSITILSFVAFKAKDLLHSQEAYWVFFIGGMISFISFNAVVVNLTKLIRYKSNKEKIFKEAGQRYIETLEQKHSELKQRTEQEAFHLQKREYSKASRIKTSEYAEEQASILTELNSSFPNAAS